MAKRSLTVTTLTPTATADSTDLVDATYHGIVQGGSGTQRVNIIEVFESGQAAAAAVTIMLLSRDTQVATGSITKSSGVTDEPLDAATVALAAPPLTGNQAATNKPRRSATGHLLNLSFNAFGGLVRWTAAPFEEVSLIGNTQPLGELSLSAFTGGAPGLLGSHVIYEPL